MRYFAERARLGEGLELHSDVILEVDEAGRLTSVEPEQSDDSGAVTLKGVVCPGLIDCHVHLGLSGGSDVVKDSESLTPTAAAERVLRNAATHLRDGVIAVRDLGSADDVVLTLNQANSPIALPHIVAAGAITNPGGHGHFIAREADGPEEVQQSVRAIAEAGAHWLKVFVTGGVITAGSVPGERQFNDDELQIAVQTAHELDLSVAAHAHSKEGILAAVHAGVDSVEHASYADVETARILVETGSVVVSTLVATERFVQNLRGTPAEAATKIRRHAPYERRALTYLVASGARLAAGTDAGSIHNPHGGGLPEQAQLLSRAGMESLEVLKVLTVHGAELLRIPAGYLSPGRSADWIVLEDDPIDDLTALNRVVDVILSGRPIGLRPKHV